MLKKANSKLKSCIGGQTWQWQGHSSIHQNLPKPSSSCVAVVSHLLAKAKKKWPIFQLFSFPPAQLEFEVEWRLACRAGSEQGWSLAQSYTIGFSQWRISVKKCAFYKHTFKVCFICVGGFLEPTWMCLHPWRCLFISVAPETTREAKLRCYEACRWVQHHVANKIKRFSWDWNWGSIDSKRCDSHY